MRVVVVGAGPVGSLSALMLARRGHEVALVDRDPGPVGDEPWRRRGVMQFHLPHFFRPQVRQAICAEVPELWSALLLAGGVAARPDGAPEEMTGLQCRRSTFDRAVWQFLAAEPGVARVTGHVDRLIVDGERVTGVVVDGVEVDADLVVVAAGRAGRLGDELRAPGESENCGFSYAARQYRCRADVELPTWGAPTMKLYDGYFSIVFPQDANTLSALIVRPTDDSALAALRHNEAFEAAAAAVPLLAEWTDPQRFEPITDVLAGSNLLNAYRGNRRPDGGYTDGVVFVGDAMCTTNPAGGRGVALGMQQAAQFVALLGSSADIPTAVAAFDAWCDEHMRPWYEDHVERDRAMLDLFAGAEIDVEGHLPADLIVACAEVDPSIFAVAGPYLGMVVGPRALAAVEERARAVLRTGWRPSFEAGPSRDDLVDVILQPAA